MEWDSLLSVFRFVNLSVLLRTQILCLYGMREVLYHEGFLLVLEDSSKKNQIKC